MISCEKGVPAVQLLVDQGRLAKALQLIGRVVPKRPVSPILGSVLVSATPGRLRLRATDLQSYADLWLPADVHLAGEAAVHARVFADVLATLPPGEVAISQSDSGESLRVTGGAAAFRLRTLDAVDFPAQAVEVDPGLEIGREHLIDLISRTTFCAVDSDEVSPFAGVSIRTDGEDLIMAATDSFQLAHYRKAARRAGPGSRGEGAETHAVLPTGALNLFSRALQSFGDEVVAIGWEAGSVAFTTGGLTWLIRCLDVQYPDMSRYTGTLAGVGVRVGRDRLLEAVRQVSSLGDEHRAVGLELRGDRLSLHAFDQELGEAQSAIALSERYPPRRVWLDARRLINALRAQPDDDLRLYVSEPLGPVAIVPATEEVAFRTILMPLRRPAAESEAV